MTQSSKILCALILSVTQGAFFCFCQAVLDLLEHDDSVTVKNLTDA